MMPFEFEVLKEIVSAISEGVAAPIEHIQDKQIEKQNIRLKMKEVNADKAHCELKREIIRYLCLVESGHQKMEQLLMLRMINQQEHFLSKTGSKEDVEYDECGFFVEGFDSDDGIAD